MDTVTVVQAEAAPLAPASRTLPVLDMDEVYRELAECLGYIESLPRHYDPDGQVLESAGSADTPSGEPRTASHRAIQAPHSSNSP
ncbi:hypothetical protein [Streptomyces sp. NBC_01353]|uniref:hypothetical protein n=1 Tax=Streptomyces sp. NBC_01353 TaxID=2903835 RepID=UPI002E2F6646|nr:hypothetical protein [Streptomyces sp. NBC_01353]